MAFSYDFTPRAEQSVSDAQTYLAQFGADVPLRFTKALQEAVTAVCETAGAQHQPVDEGGSLAFSRPVFLRLFTTVKQRKRASNAGVWRLYYGLDDADGDGRADTVIVLLIRHSAAQPLTAFLDSPSETGEPGESDEPDAE